MTWKQLFTSSIGKKITMAFTGLFLILFLIVHAGINSSIFLNDGGQTFNTVAHFMSHNWIMRFLEIGLIVGILVHAIQGIILWRQNAAARPVGYAVTKASKNSTWYSRSMGLLGTLVLIFLIIHFSHFYVGTKVALYSGDQPHNLFEEMKLVFSEWYIVVFYLFSLVALFWHLIHGFQSAFQTFGMNHKRYTPIIKAAGWIYTIIIITAFALMPILIFTGVIA
ncbi:MAG: succinate dehydrogenase cytochrome b subunit [Chitinophagaceae bacterium]|nr:MAG: succinate dehydrogenase cytochrome b subunit [Chitinophagaceae bacterium]